MKPIIFRVVQGDDFNFHFTLTAEDIPVNSSYIQSVVCTCPEMNLTQIMSYDTNFQEYVFSLTKTQTALLYVGDLEFFITVTFAGGEVQTFIYKGIFKVLQRENND